MENGKTTTNAKLDDFSRMKAEYKESFDQTKPVGFLRKLAYTWDMFKLVNKWNKREYPNRWTRQFSGSYIRKRHNAMMLAALSVKSKRYEDAWLKYIVANTDLKENANKINNMIVPDNLYKDNVPDDYWDKRIEQIRQVQAEENSRRVKRRRRKNGS